MLTRAMAKKQREVDKHAKSFAKCAIELQLELSKAHREFKSLKFLQNALNFELQVSDTPWIIDLVKSSVQYLNPHSWWQQPKSDPPIFNDIANIQQVSDNFATLLKIELWDESQNLNLDQIQLFMQEFEKNIYFYIAGIQHAPKLYGRFQCLPTHKQSHIKTQAKKHEILLDDFSGGILMHLVQHVCRIPMLLNSLSEHANKSSCLAVHQLTEQINVIKLGCERLIETINQDAEKPSLQSVR